MPLSVTSWFIDQTQSFQTEPVRRFTIGGSDFSEHINRWPSFTRSWNDIRPTNLTMQLDNRNKTFNFFLSDKTTLATSAGIQFGYRGPNVIYGDVNSGSIPLNTGWQPVEVMWTDSYTIVDSHGQAYGYMLQVSSEDSIVGSDFPLPSFEGYALKNSAATSHFHLARITRYHSANNSYQYCEVRFRTDNTTYVLTDVHCTVNSELSWVKPYWVGSTEYYHFKVTMAAWSGTPAFVGGIRAELYPSVGYTWATFTSSATGELVVRDLQFRRAEELVDFYIGDIDKVNYRGGDISINLVDKFQGLSDRVIGTQNSPVDYTGSNHLVSDIAWYVCTSHGGLDGTQSSANVDIDYDSFSEWASIFSGDAVTIQSRFTGQKATDALKRIGRITRSAIFVSENKITFRRFSLVDSEITAFTEDDIISSEVLLDYDNIVNRQYVMFNYDVNSRYHQATIVVANSASVNSYGIHEDIEKDAKVWFVDSASAINTGERIILTSKLPYNKLTVETTLRGIPLLIGDLLQADQSLYDISAETYRIMKASYNLDRGICKFEVDASQLNDAFILNTSSLDGADILS